ncbi:disks large-associated protein 5 [Hyalella azteca]|uniref:Disks large-associated protein 5 n=1 Tax=Hyalella azteca TaxID=294128 RepID=A0A8B7NXS4_HYAAZ|nr:disks large-associated protein 5 [Hyalella azteca]XP_018018573.1 disks large-associated protein 5 [Hyalella azteca]
MTSDLTSVGDFRTIVARVSDQLTSLCQKWRQEISSDAKLTVHLISDDVLGDINVAIGQAELLKKERFKQFVGLIDACEFKRGEKETTIQDLQGFWDIIYFQVDDILQKFSALQKLKANKWIEIPKNVAKPVPSKNNLVKSRPPTGKIRTASSLSLKAHIMAARSRMNQLSLSSDAVEEKSEKSGRIGPIVIQDSSPVKVSSEDKENIPCVKSSSKSLFPSEKVSIGLNEFQKTETENSSDSLCGPKTSKGALQTLSDNENSDACPNMLTKMAGQKKSKDLLIPEINTFDAGFFKVQTPSKSNKPNKTALSTPPRHLCVPGSDTKVLSSSLLKERIKRTPVTHKDYSPCMRITRSMKKMRFASAQKLYSEFF